VDAYNPKLKQHFPMKKIGMNKSNVNSKGRQRSVLSTKSTMSSPTADLTSQNSIVENLSSVNGGKSSLLALSGAYSLSADTNNIVRSQFNKRSPSLNKDVVQNQLINQQAYGGNGLGDMHMQNMTFSEIMKQRW